MEMYSVKRILIVMFAFCLLHSSGNAKIALALRKKNNSVQAT